MENIKIICAYQFNMRTMLKKFNPYPLSCGVCDTHIMNMEIINVYLLDNENIISAIALMSRKEYTCKNCNEVMYIPKTYASPNEACESAKLFIYEKNILNNFSDMFFIDFHDLYHGVMLEHELYKGKVEDIHDFFKKHQEKLYELFQ